MRILIALVVLTTLAACAGQPGSGRFTGGYIGLNGGVARGE